MHTLHLHTLKEDVTPLRTHPMAYEPVLAQTSVTVDSELTSRENSGFRYYLRSMSSASTPTKATNTGFIIPQNEAVSSQLCPGNYVCVEVDSWKHSPWKEKKPNDAISLTDSSSINTATAALDFTANRKNDFHGSRQSSSAFSSPIDSLRSTSMEQVEIESVEAEKHIGDLTTAQSISKISQKSGSSQVISVWFQKLFGRKEIITAKTPQYPTFPNDSLRSPIVSSHEFLTKDKNNSDLEKQRQLQVVEMRTAEVSSFESGDDTSIPLVHWTESVMAIRDPTSTKKALRTTCIQSTCGEISQVAASPPQTTTNAPLLMHVRKVETASLPTTGRLSSMVSVFALEPQPSRCVNLQNKSTSPLTILPGFSDTSANEVEEPPPARHPSYWYRDDPDSTHLSTHVDLESDTCSLQQSDDSLLTESESPYGLESTKTACPSSSINEGPPHQSSKRTPVCINTNHESGISSSFVESSECTVTQTDLDFQNSRSFWADDESSANWPSIVKNPVSNTIVQIPLSSKHEHEKHSEADNLAMTRTAPTRPQRIEIMKSPLYLDRSPLKSRNKTPPAVVFRRSRDIVNGVPSPLSLYPVGSKAVAAFKHNEPATLPQAKRRFCELVNSSSPVSPISSLSQSQTKIEDRKVSRVDAIDDLNRSTCDVEHFTISNLTPKRNAVAGTFLENNANKNTQKLNENSVEAEGTGNLQQTVMNFRSSMEMFIPTPLQVPPQSSSVQSSDDVSLKKHIPTTAVTDPVAKTMSTVFLQCKLANENVNSEAGGNIGVQQQKLVARALKPTVVNEFFNSADKMLIDKINHQTSREVTDNLDTLSPCRTEQIITPVSHNKEADSDRIALSTTSTSLNLSGEMQTRSLVTHPTTEKETIFQSTINPIVIPQIHSKPIADPMPQTTCEPRDKRVVVDTCAFFPQSSTQAILQSPIPDKNSGVTRKRGQGTPTSPTGQHFFPKTRQPPQAPSSGTSPRNESEMEKKKIEPTPLTNDLKEEAHLTPSSIPAVTSTPTLQSTKIVRGSQCAKRPQTFIVSTAHESGQEDLQVPLETYRNISPEEHFVMHEKVGGGKFGRVMRCENKQTHQILAIKEIKTDRLPRHTSGDVLEVAVLRSIGRHSNIACLFSVYEVQRTCFIITEYVGGGALYDRVVAEDNLDEKVSASIIRQMLLGLEHIQACSVLHLDLKPENVMMVAPSGYQLKIIDFGLAYFHDPERPRRQMGGTFTYSAPETISYENQSFATDIWSVAVIAFELLSGITPFECPQSGTSDRELTMPEITTNIINCRYNFDDDGICDATQIAKDFIAMILKKNPRDRPSVKECLQHPWMQMSEELPTVRRAVSIRRRASALVKTRSFEYGQVRITTDNVIY